MNRHLVIVLSRIVHSLPLWCAVSAALLSARSVQADLVISAQSVTANAGSNGNTLEIDLTNTGPNTVTGIAGFSWSISTGTSNIIFTGATTADSPQTTTYPYIFSGNSFADTFLGSDITSGIPGQSLSASDGTNSGTVSLGVGALATVSLGEAFFNVAPGTPGGPIQVTFDTSVTTLSGPAAPPNFIPPSIPINTFNDGTITVNASAVPEPSTLVLALLSCPAGLWMARRQRLAAVRAARNGAGDSAWSGA